MGIFSEAKECMAGVRSYDTLCDGGKIYFDVQVMKAARYVVGGSGADGRLARLDMAPPAMRKLIEDKVAEYDKRGRR